MSRRLFILVAALLTIGIAVAVAWRLRQPTAATGSAVATVNGSPITERELEIRVATLLPVASFHGNIPPEKLASLKRAALDDLILDELIWQDARRRGRTPDPAAVEAELSDVRQRFASLEEFEAALREDHVTFDAFRRRLGRTVLVRLVRREHATLPTLTEGDIVAYYEASKAEFLRPEQVHLMEILIKVDPAAGEEEERPARARAAVALARLRRGGAFETVAREVSEDSFGAKGGDLGWVHRGRLESGLENEVFAAPVGELREARSLAGFHLFKVVERQAAQQLTLDEARPMVVDRLQRSRREATRRDWAQRLRASARVEILDAGLHNATPMEVRTFESTPAVTPSRMPATRPSH